MAFAEEWLKHAQRCWDAERENAERLNDRRRQIYTGSAALLTLGLFSVQWLRNPTDVSNIRWEWVIWFIRGLNASSIVCFALSVAGLLVKRQDP